MRVRPRQEVGRDAAARRLALGHARYQTNPIAEIASITHSAGGRVCVDGVAYAPHALVDVKAWDIDYYFLSVYKMYGPHLGVLYGKREALADTSNQNYFFYEGQRPQSLHPTGDQYEFVASAMGVLDYLDSLYAHHFAHGNKRIHERAAGVLELFASVEERLIGKLREFLTFKAAVRVIGPQTGNRNRRMPRIAFHSQLRSSESVAKSLASRKNCSRFRPLPQYSLPAGARHQGTQ